MSQRAKPLCADRRFKVNLMHAQDARWVFVRVIKGFWMRLDACVATTPCELCRAPIGEPCRGASGLPQSATHWVRRKTASRRRK